MGLNPAINVKKNAYLEVNEYDGFELLYQPLATTILNLKLVKISLNLP